MAGTQRQVRRYGEDILYYTHSSLNRPSFLTRCVFSAFHSLMRGIFVRADGKLLIRSFLLFAFMGGACIVLIGITPADCFRVFSARDYERPSEIYAIGTDGKPMLIAEFYRQARKVISLEKQIATPSDNLLRNNSKKTGRQEETQTLVQKEKEVPLDDPLDSRVIRTLLSTEDSRFFSHFGVDPAGILRAIWINIRSGKVREGASTITQQVARLRFLNRERHIVRKIREAFLAILLEIRYSKRKIIEDYLNMLPLGHGTNGIETASRFYFNKHYQELSWGESAILASLTTRPSYFSPIRHPTHSIGKVRVTLQKLVENGQLSATEARQEWENLRTGFYAILNRSPNDSAFQQRLNMHPYVTAYIRHQLPPQFRNNRILYEGGLRIHTTIQHKHQVAAEESFLPHLKELTQVYRRKPFDRYGIFESDFEDIQELTGHLFEFPDFRIKISRQQRNFQHSFHQEMLPALPLLSFVTGYSSLSNALDYHYVQNDKPGVIRQKPVEGALISMEPKTGSITAIIGGSGFTSRNQQLRFHRIRRQTGSSFKPIIVAAALEYTSKNPKEQQPITAASIFEDTPLHFLNHDLTEYSPSNYSHNYEGMITLRDALVRSKNSVAIQVYQQVGFSKINPIAEKILHFGSIPGERKGKLPSDSTVALGSTGLSPLQMAAAYSVFASGGWDVQPHIITHITDSQGNILYDKRGFLQKRERKRILDVNNAAIIVSLLEDTVLKGTGKAARLVGRRTAGKTGTTNRSTDAWFAGFTPQLVTVVYIGYDTPASLGFGGTGGNLAAPVWGRYMYQALKRTPAKAYPFEESSLKRIEICKETGMLPTPSCREKIIELFADGTEPRKAGESPLFQPKPEPDQRPEGVFNDEEILF